MYVCSQLGTLLGIFILVANGILEANFKSFSTLATAFNDVSEQSMKLLAVFLNSVS